MAAEYWVLSIFAIVVALAAGFIGGRMSAPRQRRVEAMERERDAAREEAEAVRAEVSRHFEESARMFGKLASDYRTFFQQFAETAQNLGLSEGRARELLHQADPSLVSRQGQAERVADADPAGAASGAPAAATETATDGASAGEAPAGERADREEGGADETRDQSRRTGREAPEPAAAATDEHAEEQPAATASTADATDRAAPTAEAERGDGEPRTRSSS